MTRIANLRNDRKDRDGMVDKVACTPRDQFPHNEGSAALETKKKMCKIH